MAVLRFFFSGLFTPTHFSAPIAQLCMDQETSTLLGAEVQSRPSLPAAGPCPFGCGAVEVRSAHLTSCTAISLAASDLGFISEGVNWWDAYISGGFPLDGWDGARWHPKLKQLLVLEFCHPLYMIHNQVRKGELEAPFVLACAIRSLLEARYLLRD